MDLERVVGTSTPTVKRDIFCLSVAVLVSIWLLSRIKITANTVGEHSVLPLSSFDLSGFFNYELEDKSAQRLEASS